MGVESKQPNMIGVLLISLVCLQVSSEPVDTLNVHLNFESLEHPGSHEAPESPESSGSTEAPGSAEAPGSPEAPGTTTIDLNEMCKDVDCEGKRTTLTISCCKSKNRGLIGRIRNRYMNKNNQVIQMDNACRDIECGNRRGDTWAIACCKAKPKPPCTTCSTTKAPPTPAPQTTPDIIIGPTTLLSTIQPTTKKYFPTTDPWVSTTTRPYPPTTPAPNPAADTLIKNICQHVKCTGKRTAISINCCGFK